MTFTLTTGIHGILRNDDRVTFTPIDNKTLQGDLNYKALGFLSKLLSLPPNWKIQVNDLMTRFQVKRYTVLARLRELEAAGYLIRQRLKDEAGRFYYVHIIRETPNTVGIVKGGLGGEVVETSDSAGSSVVRFSVVKSPAVRKSDILINNNSTKKDKEIILDLSPTSLKPEPDERDLWSSDFSDPEAIETYLCQPISAPEITSTTLVSSEGESSAASYKKPTLKTTKPNRKQKRTAQHKGTWLERGQENGLWQSQEELDAFMVALHRHAANNPKLHSPGKWVESEIEKTCTNGIGSHWIEYQYNLSIGTMDKKPWCDIDGNVNLSFRSYVEQSKFGESGNSTSRAVELAAQVFADPAKALLMWNEYQRRLERELEEKAKYDRLGVTYDAPGVLKPKYEISADRTAETQQLLRIDAAPQIDQPIIAAADPAMLESEADYDFDSIDWDTVAAEAEAKLKMLALGIDMSISKPQPQVTPLSAVYGEPKPIDQDEAKEFNVWCDLAKAKGLISYGYSNPDSGCLVVVLPDDLTVMPWKDARDLFGTLD
jgi:hypothetical protein